MDTRKAQARMDQLNEIGELLGGVQRFKQDLEKWGYPQSEHDSRLKYCISLYQDMMKDPLNQTAGFTKALAELSRDVNQLHSDLEGKHALWEPIEVEPDEKPEKKKTASSQSKATPEPKSATPEPKTPKIREDKHHERKEKKEPAVATQIDPRLPPIAVAAQKADQILKGNGTPAMVQFRFKELALANSLWGKAMQVFGPIEKVQHGTPYIVRLSQQVYSQLRQADAKLPKFDQLPQAPMPSAGPQVTPDEPKKSGPKR